MQLEIHNYAEIIAFATGLIMLPRLRLPIMRWLVIFLFLTVIVELSSLYLTTKFIFKYSTKIYNFYIGILISFFLLFLFAAFKKAINKRITASALFIFLTFYTVNLLVLHQLKDFNYFSYLLCSFFFILLTCMY